MKISIEEKDDSQKYHPVPVDQFIQMVKTFDDRVEIYVPNLCGGETKITIFRSGYPDGNTENLARLKQDKSELLALLESRPKLDDIHDGNERFLAKVGEWFIINSEKIKRLINE